MHEKKEEGPTEERERTINEPFLSGNHQSRLETTTAANEREGRNSFNNREPEERAAKERNASGFNSRVQHKRKINNQHQ